MHNILLGRKVPPQLTCIRILLQTNDRITKMRNAVSNFILNHIPEHSVVGINQFDSSAYQLSPMTEITSDTDRSALVSNLPFSASGGTDIDDGLLLCKQVNR